MASRRTELMFQEAETTYSTAAKSELHSEFERAFRLYVKAAEDFLHLSQISQDARQRASCKDQAAKALERAEKIKVARPELRPHARHHFAEQEQLYVLRKSSLVNDVRFPLWDEDATINYDIRHPALSPDQQRNLAAWKKAGNSQVIVESEPLEPQDIVQHIITDCSVCGSIAICICHNRRFQTEIGWASLLPAENDRPALGVSLGIYHARLLFNGAYRRVAIDDQLPAYPDGSLMCLSTGSKQQTWPSLLEKAYMKLMGGYDFPGSDSCTDLHALAGWIPEHVSLKSPNAQRERLWTRIAQGFYNGSCMLTLGTGEKVGNVPLDDVHLLPAHCYAVIDVSPHPTRREVTILDSWIHAERPHPLGHTSATEREPSHTFRLSWDAVCNVFDGVYLSWDPGIFERQLAFHGTWSAGALSLEGEDTHSCYFALQLRTGVVQAQQGSEDIWVQLTRHVADTRRTSEYISLLVDGDEEPSHAAPDLNLLALKGEYTNGIHTLVRYTASAADQVLRIVAAYEGRLKEVGFTVTVYANSNVSWIEEIPKALYSKEVDGVFGCKNAGGHHGHPSFMDNPQYHLRIYPGESGLKHKPTANTKAATSVMLRSSRHIPINVSLVWSKGERVTEMGHNELAATSGPYGFGYAHTTRDLPAGDYTLILSTFEPQQLGAYKLRVESRLRFELTPIPQEGAGMFSKVIRGAWTAETAGGGPSSTRYATNPRYEIQVDTATQLKVRLQLLEPSPPAPINVSLFQYTTPRSVLVATSGPYSDGAAGVATPQATLAPGTYHVVPSTYNPALLRTFRLVVYSSAVVRVVAAHA